MKWQAILFDLDGTLLDTLADLADSMNLVLNRHGYPSHDYERYKYFIGNGMANLVKRSLPEAAATEETSAALLAEMRQAYAVHWADKTRPYPEILETLRFLQKRAMKLAVLSNKSDDFTKEMISRLLPEIHFENVTGAKPSVPLKPDPTAAVAIAADMGLSPAEFLYLGDSGVDMQTARAAGMYPIGVLWGFRKAEELMESGAAVLLKHPGELKEIFNFHWKGN